MQITLHGVGITCILTFAVRHLKTHMEYVVGVQTPLLLVKATSVAIRRGCADTLTFNEGNVHGHTSWVCIHPYSVAKATSLAVRRGCAFTRTLLRRQHPWPYVVGVRSPILCCEGNIRGRTSWVCIHPYSFARTSSWVCIHPYSVAKATYLAVRRGCAFTRTQLRRQHPSPYVVGVHSPVLSCEGNIRGRKSWRVCIHPYSVAKATSVAVRRGCASTGTLLRRQHPCPNVVAGVHPPVLCCEGNIRGRTSWVCIHPYSVAKEISVTDRRGGCASTRTLLRRQHPWPYVVGVHPPVLFCPYVVVGLHSPVPCCEGNIRGHTSRVCIHRYSVAKATSVAVRRGCAFTRTLLRRQHPWPYVVGVHLPILS